MRYLFASFVFAAMGLLTVSAMAADPADNDAKKDEGGARAEIREKLLKEFDKNGDGKLGDDEREAAREKMRALMGNRHGERGDRDDARPRHDGPREGEDRHEGHHDRDGHDGPDGHHDGPPKMPKPEEMFDKFDKNHDGKLDKEEFMALADFVHEHMPLPGRPDGPGAGRGPDGPPRGHFEGHFEGRLEGRFVEGDMEGPRYRDGDGAGRRFRGPDGPPPRDGDEGREFRRHDGPPRDDDGPRGDGPPRWRHFIDRDGHRGPPPGDRDDDDDRRPLKRDRSDDQKGDKDKAISAA